MHDFKILKVLNFRPIGEMVNTLPSQGNIHGFESHIGHHMLFKVPYLGAFIFNIGI